MGTPGVSQAVYEEPLAQRAPHIRKRWADARELFAHDHRKTHDVREFLGIRSFGGNAFDAHEGELLVVPHDELDAFEQVEDSAHEALQNLLAYRRAFDAALAQPHEPYGLGIAWGEGLQPAPASEITLCSFDMFRDGLGTYLTTRAL
jgi:hypothetical protein